MALTQTINYDTANNFSFDTTKIQITGGLASLKLLANPGQVFSQAFDADTGFTYDAAKAEFAAGSLLQKDQAPAAALCGATYTSGLDLSWSRGSSTTGTANGSPTLAGGKLVCTGTAQKGVTYTDAAFGVAGSGAIKFKYTPNYTTAPSQNVDICVLRASSGAADRIVFTHSPSGNTLRIAVNNASGSTVIGTSTIIGSAWTPTSGQTYEIELNWEPTAGTVRVFIDGTLHGSLSPGAWTRGTNATVLSIGASTVSYNVADASFDDVLYFNAAQHTATYEAGYIVVETLYAASSVTMPAFSYTGVGTIIAVEASAISETGAPRYIVANKFWNGSAWVASDGSYAQANTSADAIAQLPNLSVVGAVSVVVKVVFTDTNTRGSVANLSVTVTGQIYPTDDPAIEQGSGFDLDGLENFTVTSGGTGAVRFQLRLSGTLYWWNGTTWATSDGSYAQANAADDIETNKSALDAVVSVGKVAKLRALLHSETGQATPTLTQAVIDYDFFAPLPAAPTECIVYGFLRDVIGDELATAPVLIVTLATAFKWGSTYLVMPSVEEVTADGDGRVEVSLIESAMASVKYKFEVRYVDHAGRTKTLKLGRATVPAQSSVNLASLTYT